MGLAVDIFAAIGMVMSVTIVAAPLAYLTLMRRRLGRALKRPGYVSAPGSIPMQKRPSRIE